VINETVEDLNERMQLLAIVELTMPYIIDTVVSAINGDIKFEKEKVVSWLHKIFCCESSMCSKKSLTQQPDVKKTPQIEASIPIPVKEPIREQVPVPEPVKRNSRVTFAEPDNALIQVDVTSVSESNSNMVVVINSDTVDLKSLLPEITVLSEDKSSTMV
jgi:hypothetical protein